MLSKLTKSETPVILTMTQPNLANENLSPRKSMEKRIVKAPELEDSRALLETEVPVPQLPHRLVLKLQFAAIHRGANCAASFQVS